ncbi:MAG TPA: NAD(P)-binding protein, partial [Myxococcota bacterium]|nr:NAD(P)-binding protein [Myxococcota bacterium]
MSRPDAAPVRVYLCECGPILREALDLAALGHALAGAPGVEAVERQATLCSPEGQAWLGRELAAHPGCRPVVVACSPREHGRTFMDVCRRAGTNPYLLAIANVREQCAWVTREPARALEKAIALGRAAIARARLQQELEEQEIDCCPDALVLGAGVAGLTAALLLARADRRVVLVERAPAIGGRTVLLSELFPHLECASCALVPLMDEVLHHPNIEVLTSSQVERVLGSFGNFQVGIRRRARFVDPAACYGCGTCHAACPVEGPNEHQQGLGRRKAIYLPYAGALPNVSTLDAERCLRRTGQACDACQKACPFGAIDLQAQEAVLERRVGGIVVATGADTPLRGAAARMPRVITAAALERMLDPAGPTGGELRPAGLPPPRSVALVHCATADGRAPAPTCSKVCCQALAKYAHALRARLPDAKLTRLVWDECAGSKGAREFVRDAFRAPGVESVRLLPGERLEGLEERGDSVWLKLRRGRRLEVVQAEL